MHHAAIRRRVRGRRPNGVRARAPDLLELGGRDIRAVVSGDGGPELLTTGFVDGAKPVGVNDLGVMCDFSVDAEGIVGLG